ncbi:MAG: ATP-binding protein [Clostridiales bacterium]|nr:ATP-binding protein [Clostridiales bacterium]
MSKTILISADNCMLLALIAFMRTAIIMTVIFAIEAYGNFLIDKERDEEYKRLLTQASAVEGEMRVMSKNVREVESVMKKAYDLYNYSKDENYPKEISDRLLEIAKETHEIKGDYQNVLGVLNNTFLGNVKDEKLSLSEIIHLERGNVLAMAKKHGYKVQINTKIAYDCKVKETFKLMSVIRNLMTNACEAIGEDQGKIVISVTPVYEDPKALKVQPDALDIRIKDDGPGIPKDEIENIFLEGYSTKFNSETGNIERGLGLCLVKDYVENDFGGSLEIDSEVGKYTEFALLLPFSNFSN